LIWILGYDIHFDVCRLFKVKTPKGYNKARYVLLEVVMNKIAQDTKLNYTLFVDEILIVFCCRFFLKLNLFLLLSFLHNIVVLINLLHIQNFIQSFIRLLTVWKSDFVIQDHTFRAVKTFNFSREIQNLAQSHTVHAQLDSLGHSEWPSCNAKTIPQPMGKWHEMKSWSMWHGCHFEIRLDGLHGGETCRSICGGWFVRRSPVWVSVWIALQNSVTNPI